MFDETKPRIDAASSPDQIRLVQELLVFDGADIEITGTWSDETSAAIVAVQRRWGLPPTEATATLTVLKQLVILLLHPGGTPQR